jgi:chromate transport protein ChrA
VDRRGWLDDREFEDAIVVCNLLPGPSTQAEAAGPRAIMLMQADATSHHWMTSAQFLNGVALGQVTPGSAALLARALSEPWQYAVLSAAAVLLLALRRGVVLTLLAAGATGVIIALAGARCRTDPAQQQVA